MTTSLRLGARYLSIFLGIILLSGCDENDHDVNPDPKVTIAGKDYPIVSIGSQTWTASNYAGQGGVAYDQADSRPEYGKYYSMEELNAITLPEGWRIPTREDYEKLAEFHGLTLPTKLTDAERVKPLVSTSRWKRASGTNASGFNAYPAGYIFGDASPLDGDIAEFWTSEGITFSIQEAGENLTSLRATFYQSDNSPDFKFNVRFVKD